MKHLKLILVPLSFLGFANRAFAERRNYNTSECLFETSGAWQKLKNGNGGSLFQAGASINLNVPGRDLSLTPVEMKMIHLAVNAENEKQSLKTFMDLPDRANAGTIQYFSSTQSNRLFAEVYHYPGENQYGVVVEVIWNAKTKSYQPEVLAEIADGDLFNCKNQN